MASKGKNKPAATAGALNLALLAAVSMASATPPGYKHVSAVDAAPLVSAGFVEVNPDMTFADAQGNQATRITDAGNAHLNANAEAVQAAIAAAAPASEAAAPAKSAVTIVKGFQLPEAKRGGGLVKRSESYPFGSMDVGDAFFIAATAEKPNPERSFASTVTSATNRYATPDTTKPMRTNRKGRQVHELVYSRKFAIRRIEDGAQFGQPGVAGAVVGRIA